MFQQRLWLAAGSGQLLNECITGDNWPKKDISNARLLQCVEIMRALWAGENVTFHGHVKLWKTQNYGPDPKILRFWLPLHLHRKLPNGQPGGPTDSSLSPDHERNLPK